MPAPMSMNHNPFNIIRLLWINDKDISCHLNNAFEAAIPMLNMEVRSWSGHLSVLEELGLYHHENYIDSVSAFLLDTPKAKHFTQLLEARDVRAPFDALNFGCHLALTLSSFVIEYHKTNDSIKFNPIFGYITGHWEAEKSPTNRAEGTILTITTGASRLKFSQMLFDKSQDIEIVVTCIKNRLDILPPEFISDSRIISVEELRERRQMIDIIPLHPDQWCKLANHECEYFSPRSQFALDGHMVGSDVYNNHWDYKPIALQNIKTFCSNGFKIFVEGIEDLMLDNIYNNRFHTNLFTKDRDNADAIISINKEMLQEWRDEVCIGMATIWALQGVDFDCNAYKVSVSEKVKIALDTDK